MPWSCGRCHTAPMHGSLILRQAAVPATVHLPSACLLCMVLCVCRVPSHQHAASHIEYLVTTRSRLPGWAVPEVAVRRRFRDFVSLAELLKVRHRAAGSEHCWDDVFWLCVTGWPPAANCFLAEQAHLHALEQGCLLLQYLGNGVD